MDFLTYKNKKNRHSISLKLKWVFWITFFYAALITPAYAAISHDQSLTWQTLHSKHFSLHFHDGELQLAEKSLNIAEKVFQDLQSTLEWVPADKIEIILSDEFDGSNGFVIAPFLPSLRITLYPTPPDTISEIDDWLELLITHELTHALHLDKAAGKPLALRKIFGRHPLSFPNLLQPSWIIEGLATYMETDKQRGIGRGQSAIFDMMMRMEVKKGIKTYQEVNMKTANWPSGQTRYLYGVHFFQFLESQYSKASIKRFIQNYSDNLLPFSLNENAILTYGKTMPALWHQFEEYLYKKFLPQLSTIASKNIVEGTRLTSNGYYKSYIKPLDNGNLLFAQYDGVSRPALYINKPDISVTEKIAEARNEARFDYHPESGVLVSQIETYRNTNYFFDLFSIDIATKSTKRMTRGERYRRGKWSPDGEKIIALHNKNGLHTLALLNNDGRLIDLVWEGIDGEIVGDFNWSPDGEKLVASIKRGAYSWNIEEFSIANRTWQPLISSAKNEIQPRYSSDYNKILYSANYNATYNIYEWDIKKQTIAKLSNVEGGAFNPIRNQKGDIFYIGYSGDGYDIYSIQQPQTIENNIKIPPPKSKTKPIFKKVPYEKQDYASFSKLKPTWWSPPIFAFDNVSSLVGTYFTGSDALNIHSYDSTLAFDVETNDVSAELNYTYDRWFPILQTHLSSVSKEQKNTETFHFEFIAPLIQREKRWYTGMTFRNENQIYSDKTDRTDVEDYLFGIGMVYDSRKRNIRANSTSKGTVFTFTAETSELLGSDFNGKMLLAKWRRFIPLKAEQVLALRLIGGLGLEDPRNFQLGGYFGHGNYFSGKSFSTTPFRSTLYNRRDYALRGYPTDSPSLNGRRMTMYNVEWRFPIKRIERSASSFPVGIHQISGTAFVESGAAWDGGIKPNDFHYSAGGELIFHTSYFYHFPFNIRTGYAHGFGTNGEDQFILTIGSSF